MICDKFLSITLCTCVRGCSVLLPLGQKNRMMRFGPIMKHNHLYTNLGIPDNLLNVVTFWANINAEYIYSIENFQSSECGRTCGSMAERWITTQYYIDKLSKGSQFDPGQVHNIDMNFCSACNRL